MRWLCGTPPAGWMLHPRTGPSRARGGADPAVFRPTQGRGRARSHQARAWGYSPQSSWPALGPGTCLYISASGLQGWALTFYCPARVRVPHDIQRPPLTLPSGIRPQ